jgi:hypothetical protein
MMIVKDKIKIEELKDMAKKMYGNLVKAVVDVEKEIMVVDGELHSDEEALLLEKGSNPKNLWGINIYLEIKDKNWINETSSHFSPLLASPSSVIEFDSMINLKPHFGNKTRGVDDQKTQKKIIKIVNKLVESR